MKNGDKFTKEIQMTGKNVSVNFDSPKKVKSWKLDPNVDLLFELK